MEHVVPTSNELQNEGAEEESDVEIGFEAGREAEQPNDSVLQLHQVKSLHQLVDGFQEEVWIRTKCEQESDSKDHVYHQLRHKRHVLDVLG